MDVDFTPSTPRRAAATILLRNVTAVESAQVEILLLRRNPSARFMAGVWVFPGGAVSSADGGDLRRCALRELTEECGVALSGPDALVPYSRWITPPELPIRFDALFFLAMAPAGASPAPDGAECVCARWVTAASALGQAEAGSGALPLAFPTIMTLEALSSAKTAAEALSRAPKEPLQPFRPRIVDHGEGPGVLLDGTTYQAGAEIDPTG